jgi:hypothetical protein
VTSSVAADRRPSRNCYKCGREIGPDESICEVCNRAGMATPSASQYHGTIVVAIVAGVALMAIAASLAMRGVGPFGSQVARFQVSDQAGVVATIRVTNQGTKAGRAKCQLTARDASGGALGVSSATSPEVGPGASVTFSAQLSGVGSEASSISVACQ